MRKFPPLRLREALSLGGLSARELALQTWRKILGNEIMTRAAAVSFYAMTALVPFLGLVLFLASQLLPDLTRKSGASGIGNQTVGQLEHTLQTMFPSEAYEIFRDQIVEFQKRPPVGLISLGLVLSLWLASSLYVAIIDAMNRIYGVTETRSFLKLRLTAIVMTVIESVILVGSLLAIVAGERILARLGLSAHAALVVTAVQWLVVFVMILLSFALTFFVGPDADQRWEWITPGSLLGTVIFLLVCLVLRVYVQNFANYHKTYGSLGGVMVLLFWFWVTSMVLLSAAQTNQIIEHASPLGKNVGQKVDPTEGPDLDKLTPEPAPLEQSPAK